jgi:hypothetical protein
VYDDDIGGVSVSRSSSLSLSPMNTVVSVEDSSIKRSCNNVGFEGLDGDLVVSTTLFSVSCFSGLRSFGFGFSSPEAGLLIELHHGILVNPSMSHATLMDTVYRSPLLGGKPSLLSSSRYGPLSRGGGRGEKGEVGRRRGATLVAPWCGGGASTRYGWATPPCRGHSGPTCRRIFPFCAWELGAI